MQHVSILVVVAGAQQSRGELLRKIFVVRERGRRIRRRARPQIPHHLDQTLRPGVATPHRRHHPRDQQVFHLWLSYFTSLLFLRLSPTSSP